MRKVYVEMCHNSCIIFAASRLTHKDIEGRRILDVGSLDVNGSMRSIMEAFKPEEYLGVDIQEGPGVDVVLDAADLVERFGRESFDVVLSLEVLEHVRDWRSVISSMKQVCRPGGMILMTTRSRGFEYHAHPSDFWRYETEDMRMIFSDCEILRLERDQQHPGVFVLVRKPEEFVECDLEAVQLYSIIADSRVDYVSDELLSNFASVYSRKCRAIKFSEKISNMLFRTITFRGTDRFEHI